MAGSLFNRRDFLAATAAAATLGPVPRLFSAESSPQQPLRWPVCIFVKFIQSLSFDDLAQQVADMGFQGIEATVRKKGQILPEQAADRLPALVDAMRKRNVEVMMFASGVNSVDSPHAEQVLRTAAGLGIKQYRMDYYHYDLNRPIGPQLTDLKARIKDLAAMNQQLGIQGIYQNHAGAGTVGAPVWDLHELLDGIPVEQVGVAYDTRHAAIESGQSWPVLWNIIQPHLAALFVKNAVWEGTKVVDLSLGDKGVVGQKFFDLFVKSGFQGPISLHVEYLTKASVEENLAAIKRDYQVLQKYLQS